MALLGWHAGSFKVGALDRWIGWTREQQFRRLRLVANNTRFLVLPGGCERPKTVLAPELSRGARESLRAADDRKEWGLAPGSAEPPSADGLRSIHEFLCGVPEYRKARGIRHRLPTVLAVAVAAKLSGVRGVVAIGEFASRLTQRQLSAVSAFFSPSLKRYVAPSRSSVHRILTELDPEVVDQAVRGFVAQSRCPRGALAVDGKSTARTGRRTWG